MSSHIAILEGLSMPQRRRKMAKHRRRPSKLIAAAKKCKGKTKGKYRKCVIKYMKSRKRRR